MPRREVGTKIYLDETVSVVDFVINQFDDIELKLEVFGLCSLEKYENKLLIKKPNGEKFSSKVIKNVMDNCVEFDIPGLNFDLPGFYTAQLKIKDELGKMSSAVFVFRVLEGIFDDEESQKPLKAICGDFKAGELNCGEGLEFKEVETRSSLSKNFLESFGGRYNDQ